MIQNRTLRVYFSMTHLSKEVEEGRYTSSESVLCLEGHCVCFVKDDEFECWADLVRILMRKGSEGTWRFGGYWRMFWLVLWRRLCLDRRLHWVQGSFACNSFHIFYGRRQESSTFCPSLAVRRIKDEAAFSAQWIDRLCHVSRRGTMRGTCWDNVIVGYHFVKRFWSILLHPCRLSDISRIEVTMADYHRSLSSLSPFPCLCFYL